jgi:ribosomal-protein-alanine N-acetyltransferase
MLNNNFTLFPTLTTNRLVLRALEPSDDAPVFAHRNDEVVNTYLNGFRHTSINESQAFISRVQQEITEGRTILWVLTQKGSNEFMGTICLWNISVADCSAELGYILASPFHRLGFMREAIVAVLDFAFQTMQLQTIDAYTHQHNRPSINLLRRNGFVQQTAPKKPVTEDRLCFSLSRD